MHKINGVFSAALTPINEDYSVNLNSYLSHCQWLLKQNLTGLGIFGTTGEANSFNVEAKIIGRCETSEEKKLTIKSDFGEFLY